jgi:hypothetical protein
MRECRGWAGVKNIYVFPDCCLGMSASHNARDVSVCFSGCPGSFPSARYPSNFLFGTWKPACQTDLAACDSHAHNIGSLYQNDGPLPLAAACYAPHARGFCCQCLRHAFVHGVADDFTSKDVLHASEVKPAFTSRHIRDSDKPVLVRRSRFEPLLQQIRSDWEVMARVGRGLILAFGLQCKPSSFRSRPMRSRPAAKPCSSNSGCIRRTR